MYKPMIASSLTPRQEADLLPLALQVERDCLALAQHLDRLGHRRRDPELLRVGNRIAAARVYCHSGVEVLEARRSEGGSVFATSKTPKDGAR